FIVIFFFQAEDGIRYFSRDWSSDVCSSDLNEQFNSAFTGVFSQVKERKQLVFKMICTKKNRSLFEILVQHFFEISDIKWFSKVRSEERRVGKESRCMWWPEQDKKTKTTKK